MDPTKTRLRVLYSFPHKIGAGRICTTAWHQVDGVAAAGAEVVLYTGSICRAFTSAVDVHTTLSRGRFRVPYRLLGTRRACILHDWLVARKLESLKASIDIIHVWPLGALRTLKEAKRLGIPTVLERPNAHTRYAYEAVMEECRKLGLSMPPGHEHDYNAATLEREEAEYEAADYLLCPSDFVAKTFQNRGFPPAKLLRHQYGFNEKLFYPPTNAPDNAGGLRVLFAGGCAPRKGLHYALDAWLQSEASKTGSFTIAGGFIPGYAERLASQLAHPGVKVLGHRNDIPDLMRQSHILVLPSIEEGSALVTSEARGCGCVLLVSDAAGAICEHDVNALVHHARDTGMLRAHFNALENDKRLFHKLKSESLRTAATATWQSAGNILNEGYTAVVKAGRN